MNINASLRDVTDRMSVGCRPGTQKERRRRSSRAVECSKSRIHPSDDNDDDDDDDNDSRDDGVGRNLSCNADYEEHYLLIANPIRARVYMRGYMRVRVWVPPPRGSGVAERHARASATAR